MNLKNHTFSTNPWMKKHYIASLLTKHIQYAKIVSILTFFIMCFFILKDMFNPDLPWIIIFYRLIPLLLSAFLMVFVYTSLSSLKVTIKNMYLLLTGSLIIMQCGLIIHSYQYNPKYLLGLTIIIFVIFAGSLYGSKLLIPVYLIPVSITMILLIVLKKIQLNQLLEFANPLTLALVCVVLGELKKRRNIRNFIMRISLEKQNENIMNELELAKNIQNNLLPKTCPFIPHLQLHAIYKPMILLGGDFYDYIFFKQNKKLGIFLCDVSGHGVSAALIASMVKALLNTSRQRFSPANLLLYINSHLIGQTSDNFVTAFYGIYDPEELTFTYARAGHCAPYLLRDKSITRLNSKGSLLAVRPNITIEEETITLRNKDKLFLFTDGLTETTNYENLMFETQLPHILFENENKNIVQFVENIFKKLVAYNKSRYFEDDICIIGVEINK